MEHRVPFAISVKNIVHTVRHFPLLHKVMISLILRKVCLTLLKYTMNHCGFVSFINLKFQETNIQFVFSTFLPFERIHFRQETSKTQTCEIHF